ncbi:MAG: flippase [Acidobacteriota bacterium]|nr:MAG: flippase [Acidobacteriota bacterium]
MKRLIGRRVAFNAASQMGAFGSALVIQTLYMIVVARVLGPEDFGRYSFAWSMVQIFLIAGDLGLHNTAVREISSKPEASVEAASRLLGLKLGLTCGFCALICVLAMVLNLENPTRYALVLFGFGMLPHSMSVAINVLYQAHGKLYLASFNVVFIFATQFIVGVAVLVAGGRVVALASVYTVATSIALLVNLGIFVRNVHRLKWSRPVGCLAFLKKSLPVGVGSLMKSTSSRIGIALLTLMIGPFDTGVFAAAHRMTSALSNVPMAVVSALLPVLASHQGNPEALRQVVKKSVGILFLAAGALTVALLVLADPLISIVYGEDYLGAIGMLRILAWSLIPVFVGMAFENVVLSQNALVKVFPVVTGCALLVHLVACTLLIPAIGAVGVAWSTLISETLLAILMMVFALRFLVGRRRREVGEA